MAVREGVTVADGSRVAVGVDVLVEVAEGVIDAVAVRVGVTVAVADIVGVAVKITLTQLGAESDWPDGSCVCRYSS